MADLCVLKSGWNQLKRHLVPKNQSSEEAAFVFTKQVDSNFLIRDSWLLGPSDFEYQSAFHIELAEAVRARVIKHAHDSDFSIFEIHSHLGRQPARFSTSDQAGFREWVPHVRWRLKGRAYGAMVITRSTFDGLVWFADSPERLRCIKFQGGEEIQTTGLSDLLSIKETSHVY